MCKKLICLMGLALLLVMSSLVFAQTYPGKIGVGIAMGWNLPFVDAAKELRAFENTDRTPAAIDSQGWPTTDAITVLWDMRPIAPWEGSIDDPEGHFPDVSGTYKCSFNGQAIIGIFEGNFSTANQVYDSGTNTTTFDLIVPTNTTVWDNVVFISFADTKRTAGSATNTGITNLRVIRPGYPVDTTQIFHTPFINALGSASFSTWRTLGWLGANNANLDYPQQVEWSQRKLWTDATQAPFGSKLDAGCWESVIWLSNTANIDPWINIPIHASDDYITQLATLFKNNLNADRNVYVEWSNEVWNFLFWQANYNNLWGSAQGLSNVEHYAKRTAEISNIFKNVWGASAINNRVRVMNCWYDSGGLFQQQMNYINNNFGPPNQSIYAIASANYLDVRNTGLLEYGTAQEILNGMWAKSDSWVPYRQAAATVAGNWSLPGGHCAYEGGSDTGGGSTMNLPNRIAAERSAGMKDVMIHDLRDNWFPHGGGLFMYLELTSPYQRYGCWGLTDDVTDPDRNYKFAAVRDLLGGSTSPPGQATNPSPANAATGVSTTADLSFSAGSGATSHDVYFGTVSPPSFVVNQAGTTFDPGTLANSTTYYWQIDEKNANGTTTGNLWSFTTEATTPPPGQASNPSPANGATSVNINADLSWTTGSDATSHDVYFGTVSPPPFVVNQAGTTFDPGTLANSTTYYWQIDEKNASGTTTGTVWSFTTEAAGAAVTVTVNPAVQYQLIQGWGACYATSIIVTDTRAQDAYRNLGCNLLRVQIEPSSLMAPGGDLWGPFVDLTADIDENITKFNFEQSRAWFQDDVVEWLAANALEPERVKIIAACWSPPNWAKAPTGTEIPGMGVTPFVAYCNTCDSVGGTWDDGTFGWNAYQYCSRFLAAWCKGFSQHCGGIPLYGLNIQNELAFESPFNSCTLYNQARAEQIQQEGIFDPNVYANALKAVKDEFTLHPELASIEIFGPDNANLEVEPSNPWGLLFQTLGVQAVKDHSDPELINFLGTYSHNYSAPAAKRAEMFNAHWEGIDSMPGENWAAWQYPATMHAGIGVDGKEVWNEEFGGHFPTSWTNMLDMAGDMHSQLVWGHESAIIHWAFCEDSLTEHNLLATSQLDNPEQSMKYSTFKQFSRYIRPGAKCVGATFSDGSTSYGGNGDMDVENALNVSAYIHETDGRVTIVFVNMKSGSEAVTINVPTSPDVTTYNVYRSTSSDRFAQQPDLNVSGGQVSLTVPAQSIVTLTGTGPAAPQPPGQASNPSPADGATGVSTTADLSWTAGSGASSHDVYFGTVTTPPFIQNQTATSYDPGTLADSTTYYWRIDEVNTNGTTTGVVWSFTTQAAAPPPPGQLLVWDLDYAGGSASSTADVFDPDISTTAPSGVASIGPGLIPGFPSFPGLVAYQLNANTLAEAKANDEYFSWTITPNSSKQMSLTSIELRALSQNTLRTFNLFSSVDGFTTSIGSVTSSSTSPTLQTINITGHDNLTGAVEFRLYVYPGGNAYETLGIGDMTGDDLIVNGTTGTAGPPDTTPPAAPTGLTATAGDAQVSLDWADNTEPDLSYYNVKRSTTTGSPYTQIASNVTVSSYTDTGLANGTTYYYVVTAVDASSNESGNSNEASATPEGVPDTTPPAAPSSLMATSGNAQVSLDWADNTEPDLSHYNVKRSTTAGGSYTQIATNVTVSAYTNTGLTNGTTYYYVVTAVDTSSNESGNSNEASATPQAGPPPPEQQLLVWDLDWAGGSASSTADVFDPDISTTAPSGVASIASGLIPYGASFDGLVAYFLNANNLNQAKANDEYFSWTITPNSGKQMSITSIELRALSQNTSRTFNLFSSVDGFSTSIGSVLGDNTSPMLQTINITGHDNLTGAVEFRLYVYPGGNPYETLGIGDMAGNDLIVNGTTN